MLIFVSLPSCVSIRILLMRGFSDEQVIFRLNLPILQVIVKKSISTCVVCSHSWCLSTHDVYCVFCLSQVMGMMWRQSPGGLDVSLSLLLFMVMMASSPVPSSGLPGLDFIEEFIKGGK